MIATYDDAIPFDDNKTKCLEKLKSYLIGKDLIELIPLSFKFLVSIDDNSFFDQERKWEKTSSSVSFVCIGKKNNPNIDRNKVETVISNTFVSGQRYFDCDVTYVLSENWIEWFVNVHRS